MADCNNDHIQIFNSQGQFARTFGSEGAGNGQMKNPVGVGLLSNGNIVVAESDGNRLQIFDSQGNFVRIVGAGQLKNPWHLFVDSDDNILVADYMNSRIQVFHQNGNHVKTIGTGQISNPYGVCMDREGRIIVSEGGQRISIFLGSLTHQIIIQIMVISPFSSFLWLLLFHVPERKKKKEKRL